MPKTNTRVEPKKSEDGISHINIYTKGMTRLGRLLTNLADIQVDHPTYGTFRTAEGLWYYLKTGKMHENLRALTGFQAKEFGKTLEVVFNQHFQKEFKEGLYAKITSHPELLSLFKSSTLPFTHYYVYGKDNKQIVVIPKGTQWMIDYFEELRRSFND